MISLGGRSKPTAIIVKFDIVWIQVNNKMIERNPNDSKNFQLKTVADFTYEATEMIDVSVSISSPPFSFSFPSNILKRKSTRKAPQGRAAPRKCGTPRGEQCRRRCKGCFQAQAAHECFPLREPLSRSDGVQMHKMATEIENLSLEKSLQFLHVQLRICKHKAPEGFSGTKNPFGQHSTTPR